MIPPFRTLCLRTDAATMAGLSEYEVKKDHVVVRTPSEPDFWYGNSLVFRHDRVDIPAQVAQFEAVFPEATHVVLQWDAPDIDPASHTEAIAAAGLEPDPAEVLSRKGPPRDAPLPEGLTFRQIEGDADWAAVTALQTAVWRDTANDPDSHATFTARRFRNIRRHMEQGLGARFGIFDGGELVADMGIYLPGDLVRYSHVATRASHRRRGLCAALLAHTGRWAEAQVPGATQVIVADLNGEAGRVYRRAGFALSETVLSAMRPGY